MAVLGLDLGTSAVKALVLVDDGRVLAVASALGAASVAAGTAPDPARGSTIEPDEAGVERAGERHERWLSAVALTSTRSLRR
jgi:hypothetical protein